MIKKKENYLQTAITINKTDLDAAIENAEETIGNTPRIEKKEKTHMIM